VEGDPLPQREALYSLANTIAASSGAAAASGAPDTTVQYKGNRNVIKIEEIPAPSAPSPSAVPATLRLTLQPCTPPPSSSSSSSQEGLETYDVHEVIANCGYRPDTSLTRELQVHYCYASEGPMKLAAAMLAGSGGSGGGSGDCLSQVLPGKEALRSPENRFFVVGMKSYGRGSSFLLRIGYEQVEHVMTLLTEEAF
jgi:hypothetical protein